MKVILDENNTLLSVSYKINIEEENLTQIANIVPKITVEAKAPSVLVASLRVDNLELLPAAKINLSKGRKTQHLPPVSIRRTRLKKAKFKDMPAVYQMELILSTDGKTFIKDKQDIDLNKI